MKTIYEFHWKAKNAFQQTQKGKMLAKNREEVEQFLIRKQFSHIKIAKNFTFLTQPKTEEITQWIAQLALLLSSKIPLKTALIMLQTSSLNIPFYQWQTELIQQIEAGFSFSSSIEKSPQYFSAQELEMLKMGEKIGKVDLILENIAFYREKSEKLNKKVKKIMLYPMIILTIALLLSLGLLIFIVPQFIQLYASKAEQLPFITQLLFSLSTFILTHQQSLIIGLLCFFILIFFINKKTNLAHKIKLALLAKTPIFKMILHHSRMVYFTQNLALMLNAHLRLDAALSAFLSQSQDKHFAQSIQFSLERIKLGYPFAESLNTAYFDQQTIQLLTIGEKSGHLAKMAEKVSEIYQQKLDYHIDLLSQFLEPALMLVIGTIVGTIIIGLYLPIFDMGSLIQ